MKFLRNVQIFSITRSLRTRSNEFVLFIQTSGIDGIHVTYSFLNNLIYDIVVETSPKLNLLTTNLVGKCLTLNY